MAGGAGSNIPAELGTDGFCWASASPETRDEAQKNTIKIQGMRILYLFVPLWLRFRKCEDASENLNYDKFRKKSLTNKPL
jgi:hypothetical protein